MVMHFTRIKPNLILMNHNYIKQLIYLAKKNPGHAKKSECC